jgi:hypothetical protein
VTVLYERRMGQTGISVSAAIAAAALTYPAFSLTCLQPDAAQCGPWKTTGLVVTLAIGVAIGAAGRIGARRPRGPAIVIGLTVGWLCAVWTIVAGLFACLAHGTTGGSDSGPCGSSPLLWSSIFASPLVGLVGGLLARRAANAWWHSSNANEAPR